VPDAVRRRRARLALAVVLLLAVTIGAVGWWLGSGRYTDIPALVGQPKDTAIGLLQEAGLDPVVDPGQYSESVPVDQVLSASPQGGRAVRGSDVHIVVSEGAERFVVPADLVGRKRDDVLAKLQADLPQLGFSVAEVYDDKSGPGIVTAFDPPAGTKLKRGDTVTVSVSKGHAPVAVPNVVGQSPDAATGTLGQLGFQVARAEGRTTAVAAGQVMTVTPGPGDGKQPYGSSVTITVSVGVPQVTVPDVTGQPKDAAVAALQAAGLQADVSTFVAGNRVYQQNPKQGTVVDQGSTVSILVSIG
jgi:serine/threonine-protein kinase